MEDTQVQETEKSYKDLKAEAKELGITGNLGTEALVEAIAAKKAELEEVGPTGISFAEAKSIEARMRFEEETRDKIRQERKLASERNELIAESESLGIPIDLPENPTELSLVKARRTLGVQKRLEKPSPETLGIEAGKRGYYVFRNLEQKDANHTANLGGKYVIHLIAKQIHVLSDFHIKRWRQIAVTPIYERVATGINAESPKSVGMAAERCQRVGDEPRWSFEYLGEAPVDANFGLVTDAKVLEKLTATV